VAIIGTHTLLYTSRPEELRALLRDVFGFPHVDAGDGWLILALPPAETGVHPADKPSHMVSFICDDIETTMADLQAKDRVQGRTREPGLRHRRRDGAAR
jgi:hypothetical protein